MKILTLSIEKFQWLFVLVVGLLYSNNGFAQVSGYSYTSSVGTFTPIVGGTTVGNTTSSHEQYSGDPVNPVFTSANLTGTFIVGNSVGFPIGFIFNLGGLSFDRFNISTEGYIKLGSSTNPYGSIQTPSSTTTQFGSNPEGRNLIAALGNNLKAQAGASMKYLTTGSSPNRVLTVEWLGYSRNNAEGDNLNFQIKLFETTNVVSLVYGAFASNATTTISSTAGMIGLSNTDFKKVGNTLTTTTMDSAVLSPTNIVTPFTNERVQWRNGFFPTPGRTYTFTPSGVTCNYPVIPQGVASGTTMNLSWGAAAGATSYNVQYRALPADTFVAAPGGTGITGTALAVTGLTPGTTYEFRVQSNCNGENWITFSRNIPGPGETCGLAIPYGAVAPNAGACTPTTVTAGLSADGSSTISCAGVAVLTDKWYSFVAPGNGKKLIIETTADSTSNPDWAMQIYSSCGGAPIGCSDDVNGSDFRPVGQLCQFDYVGGQTYYVRLMQMFSYGSGPTIKLCIYEDEACPNPADSVARPIVSLPSGSYSGNQTVVLSSATPGSTIYYTLNGNLPVLVGSNSFTKVYSMPLVLSQSSTLRAVAAKNGVQSAFVVRNYTITNASVVANPVFSLPGGTYSGIQSLTITCATPGATIWYSTNGTVPVPGSNIAKVYDGPISLAQSMTIRAIGVLSGFVTSGSTAANYVITDVQTVAAPTFNPPPGGFAGPQSVTISCATPGAQILYTTNGMTPKFGLFAAKLYSTPVNIPSTVQLKARAFVSGSIESAVAVGNYTIGAARRAVSDESLDYYFAPEEVGSELNSPSLTAFPNPSHSGVFEVEGLDSDAARIQIVNSLGQTIDFTIDNREGNRCRIDLAKQASGLYLLKVSLATGTRELRLMK